MALTCGIVANGRAALIAMRLWEQDVNAAGGLLGRLLRRPEQPVPGIYTKLLDVDQGDITVSGYGTHLTVPAMPVVMEDKRLFVTLFALGIDTEFHYDRFVGMIPAGPSATARQALSGASSRSRNR